VVNPLTVSINGKGKERFALDLSSNCNTVKTKYPSILFNIQENPKKKFDILEKYLCGDNPI
jgi:hypothetical protein